MPAKRRSMQPQSAVLSDYDTDTAAVPINLPTPEWTIDSMNEEVLRTYLPDLEKIVKVAPFTVVYIFSPESQHWEKSGCEGTLFLCKRGAKYSTIVLNRKSLDNFEVELTSADDVEITNEYVILQSTNDDGTPQIYGLWIYNAEGQQPSTKDVMGMAIQQAALAAQLATEGPDQVQAFEDDYQGYGDMPTTQQGQTIDLAKLFNEAQVQKETHINQPLANNIGTANGQQLDLLKLFGKSQQGGNGYGYQQLSVATLFPA